MTSPIKSQGRSAAAKDVFSGGLNEDVVMHIVTFLDKPGKLALALSNSYFFGVVKRDSNKKVLSASNMCDGSHDVRPMVLLRDWMPQGYQLHCDGNRLQYKRGKAAERAQNEADWHIFWAPQGVSWGSSITSKDVCRHCISGYGVGNPL